MKKLLFLISAILSFVNFSYSQNSVAYTYDANGNRISRYVVLTDQVSPNNNQQNEDSIYFKGDMIHYELSSNILNNSVGKPLQSIPTQQAVLLQ